MADIAFNTTEGQTIARELIPAISMCWTGKTQAE